MEYNFKDIEKKWQQYWKENKVYQVKEDKNKTKYYVLDMFPYPSGAGLHVGHPLGYIASDIYSRYKRLKGFNVLHPMGYDAYGLPAEQYAIQTGQHPAITTRNNIERYRNQLDKIGFSYDWEREIQTCDSRYYKWTQWAFIQMFHSFYCYDENKAMPINELIKAFESTGTDGLNVACTEEMNFSAEEWNSKTDSQKQEILLNYRIAYLADTMVNWCPALGTVLANDEVSEGLSVRGGYPVEQKKMRQWSLRISAYAQRLLDGLNTIEWSDSLKEIQKNWIGRSEGAEINFKIKDSDINFTVFTTRADTLYGVTFMVLAPESEYVSQVVKEEYKEKVNNYLTSVKRRTERERMTDKKVSGVFTGAYAINPVNGEEIPVWISDYVLAGYGTGAIMAVPGHDSRDYAFARHFNLNIIPLIEGCDVSEESFDAKEGIMINSGFLNGLTVKEAIEKAKEYVRENKLGKIKINYRLRDAIFSRQRYWGEPFPIYYKDGLPYTVEEKDLPIELPEVDKFLPTEKGEPPLGHAKNWTYNGYPLELCTMPGFAGSSAYYIHYEDPYNEKELVDKSKNEYWRNVDLYIGGTEHATGHLIYSRFWNKFLFDIGIVCEEEPFKKLINQGMIQGRSNFVYRYYYYSVIDGIRTPVPTNIFLSKNIAENLVQGKITPDELKEIFRKNNIELDYNNETIFNSQDIQSTHVDIGIVHNDVLDIEAFREWNPEYKNAQFVLEDTKYVCGWAVEKMSKSMYNVVNPDDVVEKYGADTLRLYEMFLGPLEQSKPWDTKGIDGVSRFLRKLWGLFFVNDTLSVKEDEATSEELKSLHKLIKKVGQDIENFSFNTSVAAFMICVNELAALKCNKKDILKNLVIVLAPFAPHIAEELWYQLGNRSSVFNSMFPSYNEEYLKENEVNYSISFNGKARYVLSFPIDTPAEEVEKTVLNHENSKKWLEGKTPKKVIVVKNKIVNIVL